MNVQPKYLVVEKVVLDTDLYLSKHYISEYQTCKVIEAPIKSKHSKGSIILVGNQICFDKAPHFGDKCFYIDSSEVFGSIKDGRIIPENSIVYCEADKNKKSKVVKGDFEYYKDITYKPLETTNVTQDGFVYSVCEKAKHSVFDNELNVEVSHGDHVYCHHFLTDSDNERSFNGKKYYETWYEHLYCKVSDGEIKMLNEWNFISPVLSSNNSTDSGIIKEINKKNELRVGVINHPCKKLSDLGLKIGDKVFFKKGREYLIDVEGKSYYRIETNDILCKYENMEALGDIVIVKEIKPDNKKGGFIKTVANNPIAEKGEVISVGSNCSENIKPGDVVLFRKMANTEVEINGDVLLLMQYKNIYVKV